MATKKSAAKSAKPKKTAKPTIAEAARKAETAEARSKKAEATAEVAVAQVRRTAEQIKRKATTVPVVGKTASGFMAFLREQSVVGLAIGLVLGTQAKALVDQLIASFINPLVGLLLPGQGTLKEKVFDFTMNGKTAKFGWGAFVISLMTFVIVAAVVYFVFKGLKLDKLDKKKDE